MKNLLSNERFIRGKISGFQQTTAIIELENGQKIFWPIQRLPEPCEIGNIITLKLVTQESETLERQSVAKTIVNELLQTE